MTKDELEVKISKLEALISELDEVILSRIKSDVKEYEVQSDLGRRKIIKQSLKELKTMRDQYQLELKTAQGDLKKKTSKRGRHVLVRF